MERNRNKNSTRYLVIAAVLAALGVVLLAVGSLLQVLDLSMAALASLLVIFAVIELGGAYPYLIYAVTAILAVLLVPTKTAPLVYLCFAGFYPIIKAKLEGALSVPLAWVMKLLIFNAGFALALFAAVKLFTALVIPTFILYWLLPIGSAVFVVYDIALTKLISAYLLRWRHRFRFLHK